MNDLATLWDSILTRTGTADEWRWTAAALWGFVGTVVFLVVTGITLARLKRARVNGGSRLYLISVIIRQIVRLVIFCVGLSLGVMALLTPPGAVTVITAQEAWLRTVLGQYVLNGLVAIMLLVAALDYLDLLFWYLIRRQERRYQQRQRRRVRRETFIHDRSD